ncbi:hypothetical protein Ddc_11685 [Ditylenchus destructor]|nr:hypothetical protein Ddc_11685 [Ditylenchus destructor]
MFGVKSSAFQWILLISAVVQILDAGIVFQQSGLLSNDTSGNSYSCMYNNGVITVNGVSRNATDDEKAEMEKYMQQHSEQMSTQMMSSMQRMWDSMRKMFNGGFWGRDNRAESELSQSQKNQTQEDGWPLNGFSSGMPQTLSFCRQAQKEEGQ